MQFCSLYVTGICICA